MSKGIRTSLLAAAALAASVAAGAQTAAPYSSAFEGYRPFSADEVGDWRKANDTVREIGGWRAYAREIQGGSQSQPGTRPASAAPPAPAPSAAPARPAPPANPHQGHAR